VEASQSHPPSSFEEVVDQLPMPDDDDSLPALAPQWLRSGPSQKASLGAGVGSQAHPKGMQTSSVFWLVWVLPVLSIKVLPLDGTP
jgi:hypothetical protein